MATLGLDTSGLDRGAAKAKAELGGVGSVVGSLKSQVMGLATAFGGMFALQAIIRTGTEYASTMQRAAIFTRATAAEVTALNRIAHSAVNPLAAAQGWEMLAKKGHTAAEAISDLSSLMMFAKANALDFATALQAADISEETFGRTSEQTKQALEMFSASMSLGRGTVDSYISSMDAIGPIAEKLGYSFERTLAMFVAMSRAGVEGTKASMGLRMAMIKANEIALKYGWANADLVSVLQRMNREHMSTAEIFSNFNARQATVVAGILRQADAVDTLTDSLIASNGEMERRATLMDKTAGGRWNITKGEIAKSFTGGESATQGWANASGAVATLGMTIHGISMGLQDIVEFNKLYNTAPWKLPDFAKKLDEQNRELNATWDRIWNQAATGLTEDILATMNKPGGLGYIGSVAGGGGTSPLLSHNYPFRDVAGPDFLRGFIGTVETPEDRERRLLKERQAAEDARREKERAFEAYQNRHRGYDLPGIGYEWARAIELGTRTGYARQFAQPDIIRQRMMEGGFQTFGMGNEQRRRMGYDLQPTWASAVEGPTERQLDRQKEIAGWSSDFTRALGDMIVAGDRATDVIKRFGQTLISEIISRMMYRAIGGTVNKMFDMIIPQMAGGGVAMGPTLALIAEKGPEAVIPLAQGGGGVGGTHVTINDHRQVGSPDVEVDDMGVLDGQRELVVTIRDMMAAAAGSGVTDATMGRRYGRRASGSY